MSLQQTMGNGHHHTQKTLVNPKVHDVAPKSTNASSWTDSLASLHPTKVFIEESIRKHPAFAVTLGLAIGSAIAITLKRWRR